MKKCKWSLIFSRHLGAIINIHITVTFWKLQFKPLIREALFCSLMLAWKVLINGFGFANLIFLLQPRLSCQQNFIEFFLVTRAEPASLADHNLLSTLLSWDLTSKLSALSWARQVSGAAFMGNSFNHFLSSCDCSHFFTFVFERVVNRFVIGVWFNRDLI